MMVVPLGKDPMFGLECKNKHSKKINFLSNNQNAPNVSQSQDLSSDKSQKPKRKWTGRKVVDAFTVTAYAAIVTAAIAVKKCRSKDLKLIEECAKKAKAKKLANGDLSYQAKLYTGDHKEGGRLYRFFDKLGKWSEDSKELTNNIVYGFGTLAIMPLVILFSPIGKKDASKEDRTFTVLRQPISFATLFAVQLTFDKLFKSLADDLNKYGLLDGKKINGKEVYFSESKMRQELYDTLRKDKNQKEIKEFHFDEKALAKYKEAQKVLKEHIEGAEKDFHEGDFRFPIKKAAKGNKFTLEQFSDSIVAIIKGMGEKPVVMKDVIDSETGKVQLDSKTGKKMTETVKYFEKLQSLVAHYEKDYPTLFEKLENMAYSGMRSKALKETAAIIANSVISQALGIMMLNFVYGKMMKKVSKAKQSKEQNQVTVNGGSK